MSFLNAARYTLFCSLSYKMWGKLGRNLAVTYRASISSGRILMRYRCDRRPRLFEAEFARGDGNFVLRRARLLSLFWPVRYYAYQLSMQRGKFRAQVLPLKLRCCHGRQSKFPLETSCFIDVIWNKAHETLLFWARSIKPKFPVRIFENFFVKWNGNFHSVSFHARAG